MFDVEIAGVRFDPRDEAKDDEPAETVNWLVQLRAAPAAPVIAGLRRRHGLRLTEYVPNLTYLERLPKQRLDGVRGDPAVRAVVPFRPELKLAPLPERDAKRDEPEARWLEVGVFGDADPAAVRQLLEGLGATEIDLRDDRVLGGWPSLRFRLGDETRLVELTRHEDVRWVAPVTEVRDDGATAAPSASPAARMVGAAWRRGLHGEGQLVGILDRGLPDHARHCFFADPAGRPPGPAHRKVQAVRDLVGDELHPHATFVAGCAVGDDHAAPGAAPHRGSAWAARLVAGNRRNFRKVPGVTLLDELAAARAAGAAIHSNSWHIEPPDGARTPARYDPPAAEVDLFTWEDEDQLVIGASGNSGEEQGTPGTAKNAICVSAARAGGDVVELGDGNTGPTADGRRKPDLMAVGCGLHSALVGTDCGVGPRHECGSSYATPHVAAAAALVRQFFMEGWHPTGRATPSDRLVPSGALLKAVLLGATHGPAHPDDAEGWGVLDLSRGLPFAGDRRRMRILDVRNAEGLQTGAQRSLTVPLDGDEPLAVTLVWTEPPGAVNARPVVNDLDLVVGAPDGTTLLGNVLRHGESVPGGEPDELNNVERVVVGRPTPGAWTVTVRAVRVARGDPGQGFALVVTGALAGA